MSLVGLAHVCSHLQNASKARLGLTSISLTKLHLSLALGMQRQGFISSVTPGGPQPPIPFAMQARGDDSGPYGENNPGSYMLSKKPWLAYPSPENPQSEPQSSAQDVQVPKNRARQRLWLGLKYWNNEPVINQMTLLSKPTKRIWLNAEDLELISKGREAGYVKGLSKTGECLFITTDQGIMEIRECVEKKIGGMVLCRVF
ncbi:40S ribosomal protein-like protein S8 [Phyllosticta citrichinensis]|uniref:40S ribosomal protein-like protein S8 n=1 Tax=Phyllosticta citrichinensis TaxID=1130410 RepID=A0ABR1Y023_9PEZI